MGLRQENKREMKRKTEAHPELNGKVSH